MSTDLALQLQVADQVHKSGLLPKWVDTKEKALAVVMAAQELGVPPMAGFRDIFLVEGKVGLSAKMMLGLILRRYPTTHISYEETSTCVTVRVARPGAISASSFSFSMEDAKRANLINKNVWKSYPRNMMRWRAVSQMAQALFPEVLMGAYFAEELGAEVNAKGEIVAVPVADTQRAQELTAQLSAASSAPVVEAVEEKQAEPSLGSYTIEIGKFKGKKLDDIDVPELESWVTYFENQERDGKRLATSVQDLMDKIKQYLAEKLNSSNNSDAPGSAPGLDEQLAAGDDVPFY